jgi:CheY-like chemotaxis protein
MNDSNTVYSILIAEDDADDRLLIREAFEENRIPLDLHFVDDGEALMDYLRHHPLPDLILLDLNMPRKDGREVLFEIKADPTLKAIPVVILTTSNTREDITRCYSAGANSYITKPDSYEKFVQSIGVLEKFWFSISELPSDDHEGIGSEDE